MRAISQLSAGGKGQTGIELVFIMSDGVGALFVCVD